MKLGLIKIKSFGGDGILAELFKILEMMLLKCLTNYAGKFGKLANFHKTGKGQFSFQSQRRVMTKNIRPLYNCAHFTC